MQLDLSSQSGTLNHTPEVDRCRDRAHHAAGPGLTVHLRVRQNQQDSLTVSYCEFPDLNRRIGQRKREAFPSRCRSKFLDENRSPNRTVSNGDHTLDCLNLEKRPAWDPGAFSIFQYHRSGSGVHSQTDTARSDHYRTEVELRLHRECPCHATIGNQEGSLQTCDFSKALSKIKTGLFYHQRDVPLPVEASLLLKGESSFQHLPRNIQCQSFPPETQVGRLLGPCRNRYRNAFLVTDRYGFVHLGSRAIYQNIEAPLQSDTRDADTNRAADRSSDTLVRNSECSGPFTDGEEVSFPIPEG